MSESNRQIQEEEVRRTRDRFNLDCKDGFVDGAVERIADILLKRQPTTKAEQDRNYRRRQVRKTA